MSPVALVSDSTPGFSADFIQEHNIVVVPLYLQMGETTLRDGVDITADEFYRQLPVARVLPTTSQPSVGDFVQAYSKLAEQGATEIISIHLSSGISGTINSAQLAAKQMDDMRIEIVDTRSAAISHMYAVEEAAKALEAKASMDDALAAVQKVVDAQKIIFTVDTLEYLYKGGRIGGAAALVGSLLQFKPLLYFREGKIDALERVRTSRRALKRTAEIMGQWFEGQGPLHAGVMDAAATERAQALVELLPQYLDLASVRTYPVPPVLGTHVGNGTLGLCCCPASAFRYGPAA